MKTHLLLPASLTAILLTVPTVAASAAPLILNNVRASEAAARLSANYHINIVLKVDASQHVNVALDDADDAGTRLQTVNALANALRLDFAKTIVVTATDLVSKAADDAPDSTAVDSEASIPFGKTTLPAREAISLIAGVDDAFVQIIGKVGGFVTLSSPTLTVSQAEKEVSEQTETTWKAVYVLAPREIVASVASPMIVFPNRQREAEERREAAQEEQQAAQEQAAAYQAYQQAIAQRQASPQATSQNMPLGFGARNNQAINGMGYYSNGYSAYGSPYQNGLSSGYANGSPYQNGNSYEYGGYTNGE